MNELKLFKGFVQLGTLFLVFYLLNVHLLSGYINVWNFVFIPMGVDIFKLTRRYLKIRNKQTEIGYVALKKAGLDFSDFFPYVSVVIIAIYFQWDLIGFVILITVIGAYLRYYVKKEHLYYFTHWGIEYLSEKANDIFAKNIISFDLQPNVLKIVYLKDEDMDENDEDNLNDLWIRRCDLSYPKSWTAFEQMARNFALSCEKTQDKKLN